MNIFNSSIINMLLPPLYMSNNIDNLDITNKVIELIKMKICISMKKSKI
jgi:hypothetical protein